MQLSTNGFSRDENEFLSNLLKDRYNEYFYVSKDNKTFLIRAGDGATREFLKDINDIMPPDMERKSNIWRNEKVCFNHNQPSKHESRILLRNKNRSKIIDFINNNFLKDFTRKDIVNYVGINYAPIEKYLIFFIKNNIIEIIDPTIVRFRKFKVIKNVDSKIFDK